jgi:TonB family protein
MSVYWLIAAVATAPESETLPIVAMTPPPVTIASPPATPVSPPPPKGKESPAIPKSNPGLWANTLDYPSRALMEEREGITAFRLDVAPDGRVANCAITSSSGHADLDQTTCSNITRRAQFYPAQDKKGQPIAGSYSNRVRWQIPTSSTMASPPITNISYPRAPQLRNPASLRITKENYPAAALSALKEGVSYFNLDIDNEGKVRQCSITTSSDSEELDLQSCRLAMKWEFEPAVNLDGTPVAGRTGHNIRWRLPKGAVAAAPAGIARPVRNPFEKPGKVKMTLDFDKDGKLSDCAFEHVGDLPIFGSPPDISGSFCKSSLERGNISPFVDADGKPISRRVTVNISVDHGVVPSAAVASKAK